MFSPLLLVARFTSERPNEPRPFGLAHACQDGRLSWRPRPQAARPTLNEISCCQPNTGDFARAHRPTSSPPLITVWLEVRILPGPPRTPIRTECSGDSSISPRIRSWRPETCVLAVSRRSLENCKPMADRKRPAFVKLSRSRQVSSSHTHACPRVN